MRHSEDINSLQLHIGAEYSNDPQSTWRPNFPGIVNFASRPHSVTDHSASQQLTTWRTNPPQNWTKKDVLDWIYHVVEEEHLDGSKFQGEAYRTFAGLDMCKMDRKQFQNVDPVYGPKIYEAFQNCLNRVSAQIERPVDRMGLGNVSNNMSSTECSYVDGNNNMIITNIPFAANPENVCGLNGNIINNNDLVVIQTDNETTVHLENLGDYPISENIDLPLNSPFTFSSTPKGISHLEDFFTISSSFDSHLPALTRVPLPTTFMGNLKRSHISNPSTIFQAQQQWSTISSSMTSGSTSFSRQPVSLLIPQSPISLLPDLSPPESIDDVHDVGYCSEDSAQDMSFMPPVDESPSTTNTFVNDIPGLEINGTSKLGSPGETRLTTDYNKIKRTPANKGNHLHKFVLELLCDPSCNPGLIKWEDKDNGVFRFVQSEKVAKLWGAKKNNPVMTYEKLSRAMRFCRKAGYFGSVPRTGRYPKKLCFMFGVKAEGWKV